APGGQDAMTLLTLCDTVGRDPSGCRIVSRVSEPPDKAAKACAHRLNLSSPAIEGSPHRRCGLAARTRSPFRVDATNPPRTAHPQQRGSVPRCEDPAISRRAGAAAHGAPKAFPA